jgi:hypothetical protein
MTSASTNSWIFLTVAMASSELPITLDGIIGAADAINHAIPTYMELQTAFGWLSNQGMISKDGKKYRLTKKGLALYKEANAKSKRTLGVWNYLNEYLAQLNSADDVDSLTQEVDSLTQDEVDTAYENYNQKFWKMVHK